MKKPLVILATALTLLTTKISFGQITGTSHDFSNAVWNTSGEICIVCHTPHNADATLTPLWNRQSTESAYTLYSNSTFDGAATITQPDGPSKMCLSCHDGTIALENYSGNVTGTHFVTGGANLGTNLNNEHPISFDYTSSLANADGALFDPTTTPSGITPTGTIQSDMLFSNKMQCASCHNPHGTGNPSFLRKSNTVPASGLCLTCHNI